jgi:hypothetical protein
LAYEAAFDPLRRKDLETGTAGLETATIIDTQSGSTAARTAPLLIVDSTADRVTNAAESTNVQLAVPGPAAGMNTTLTFTDASGHHLTSAIEANRTYSAHLTVLTDGADASSITTICAQVVHANCEG